MKKNPQKQKKNQKKNTKNLKKYQKSKSMIKKILEKEKTELLPKPPKYSQKHNKRNQK